MPRNVLQEFRKPEWMPVSEAKRFYRFKEDLRSKVNGLLPAEEFEFYALMEWVQRKHSSSNPRKPEFPPWNPAFPATPTRRLQIPGLEHLKIYVKDESANLSGTHKSRMAWEIARLRHQALKEQLEQGKTAEAPNYSVISSGNTALSIAKMLNAFRAPTKIRALVDEDLPEKMEKQLARNNVLVFRTDLEKGVLNSDRILRLTKNPNGIDLTQGRFHHEISRSYYDWLSYEIFNAKPHFVIVPYGSGELFDNILGHYSTERYEKDRDPRLLVSRKELRGINLIGVTAEKGSLADKLMAPFLPGSTKEEYYGQKANIIDAAKKQGVLGEHSQIARVPDSYFFKAHQLAERLGINAEYSGLAGLAWLLKNGYTLPKNSRVVIVNTGKGLLLEE